MAKESKTKYQLTQMVADLAGFDPKIVLVEKSGHSGDFIARVTGATAWLTKAKAQDEVDTACLALRQKYRLLDQ